VVGIVEADGHHLARPRHRREQMYIREGRIRGAVSNDSLDFRPELHPLSNQLDCIIRKRRKAFVKIDQAVALDRPESGAAFILVPDYFHCSTPYDPIVLGGNGPHCVAVTSCMLETREPHAALSRSPSVQCSKVRPQGSRQ